MSLWYRAGTVSVANAGNAVTGTTTGWVNQVKEGDRITFDGGGKWYEIASTPTVNTSLTLATPFGESTLSGAAYAIDRSSPRWTLASDIAISIATLLALVPQPIAGDAGKIPKINSELTAFEYASIVSVIGYTPADRAGDAFSGAVGFAAGTVTDPSLFASGDTNTGIWFPGADMMAASAGGAEKMRITSSGLGIGTTSPAAPLDVDGNVFFRTVLYASDLRPYSGGMTVGPANAQALTLRANNLTGMTIATSGYVGIGTTSPETRFAVVGSTDAASVTADGSSAQLRLSRSGSEAGSMSLGADAEGFHVFNRPAYSKLFTVRNDSGFVGVGTTTPANRLDVVGTVQMDALRIDATPSASSATATHKIAVNLAGTVYYLLLSNA